MHTKLIQKVPITYTTSSKIHFFKLHPNIEAENLFVLTGDLLKSPQKLGHGNSVSKKCFTDLSFVSSP